MSDSPLFMLRAEFDELALSRFAARAGINLSVADGGYILHTALAALFGEAAPRPFAVRDERARQLTLYGYSTEDHRSLSERARALADPLAAATIDFESFCSKAMPSNWRAGARYRFESRVCPIVRISGRSRGEQPSETDAFLYRCLREGPAVKVNRQTVYRDWLEKEIGRYGAARLVDRDYVRLTRLQRQRLARRDRSGVRSSLRLCERPDATLSSVLEIVSPEAFGKLLRRGLGRHRAFGFGMLLLRP
ncbi:MAG TPA: type I-E CRISPR-associated protein Cas6/Cse3/CasE [Candidatus Binataceae bacterium]|nr:type I-E CRISPR-associated protein Cas6/Cse3/CasE [Candidatus Binataceae bacterium]